jgi:hypothetical protein
MVFLVLGLEFGWRAQADLAVQESVVEFMRVIVSRAGS